ncbi:mobile mystery protein A [Flavobacterium sp. IMCC34518]|jgi:predicted DNA-binding mobile mystery protein A|uniref:mobile mystery protein A n=1 Tax=Flavobacterium sp. IMCC34518 TaxID=3003623 RepID=UPI0022AC0385|nr:mobile mystery protein A [Flavobacterium sp. IMCC34518]
MKNTKQQLILDQTDRKLITFRSLQSVIIPPKGWINTFRTALKMSLRQLGNRMNFTAQNIKQMEEREVNGTISINSLQQVARALDMKLVYGFVSKHESLEQMIEKRANEIAREIVMRTNNSMTLEDQQNSEERIKKAIAQKTVEIKNEMPKYLWD